jgi:hypothetical protein
MSSVANNPGKAKKIGVWHWLVIFITGIGGALYLLSHYNPFPSDEAMIAHFQTHRAEIESLVKSYREFMPTPEKSNWEELPEVKVLQKKAGVEWVDGGGPTWFPNPYSVEAAKQFHADLKAGRLPGFDLRPYKTINIVEHVHHSLRLVLLTSGTEMAFKNLAYMPEIPRIENGILLHAASTTSPSAPS